MARIVMVGRNERRPMSNIPNPEIDVVYQLKLKGQLGRQWTDWFDGLTLTLAEDGDTLLTGPVADQAALYGLLKRVRDLGISLVSVNPVRFDRKQLEKGEKNESN
jgi:hypothetical protein